MDPIVCRICLATDVKLHAFTKNLSMAYEKLLSFKIPDPGSLSRYICSFCSALLRKCLAFKEKCIATCTIFNYANKLTLNEIIPELRNYKHPYTISNNDSIIEMTHTDVIIKEEEIPVSEEIKVETIDLKKKTGKKKTVEYIKLEDVDCRDDFALDDFNDDSNEFEVRIDEVLGDGEEVEFNENDVIDVIIDGSDDFNDDQVNVSINDSLIIDDPLHDMKIMILSKEEQLKEIEERKISSNYTNSEFKCNLCYRGFMLATTYRNHMVKHDPAKGNFECEICKTRFSEGRSLKSHMVNTHERKYICKLCDHVSRSSHRAKEHSKWHSGFKFVCKICGASFAKSTSHLTHIRLQHPSTNACDICGESFIGDLGLRMHKKKAHSMNVTSEKMAQCEHCEFVFQSSQALWRHLENTVIDGCNNMSIRPCGLCGDSFQSIKELQEHIQDHPKDERVSCEECKLTFVSSRSHAIHYQRVHLGVKLKQAKRTSAKRAGEAARAPPGARPSAICEVCGYKCISKATLICHQRIHTGEKPYACNECPKKFSVLQRLQIHIRTHTGESPYKCAHCPKAFKHKAALNRHDRVHTGVKPYSCSHCGKCFSQSNSLKLHVNTVHLKLPPPYRHRRNRLT